MAFLIVVSVFLGGCYCLLMVFLIVFSASDLFLEVFRFPGAAGGDHRQRAGAFHLRQRVEVGGSKRWVWSVLVVECSKWKSVSVSR